MKYYSLLFVFALLSGGCVSNAAKTEKSEAAVDSPTVVVGETADKSAVEAPDVDPEKEAEAKIAFVEKFYAEWDDILNYNSLIPYITPKLRKWLSENYDYDCEGECLATWLFFYEGGGDCGALLSRQVKVQDAKTTFSFQNKLRQLRVRCSLHLRLSSRATPIRLTSSSKYALSIRMSSPPDHLPHTSNAANSLRLAAFLFTP